MYTKCGTILHTERHPGHRDKGNGKESVKQQVDSAKGGMDETAFLES